MKHTQGKWTVKVNQGLGFQVNAIHKSGIIEPVCYLSIGNPCKEANAKRIVQMNNSFDGLLEALKEISKGEGAFNRDNLTHACNCIESMKSIAIKAIAQVEEAVTA